MSEGGIKLGQRNKYRVKGVGRRNGKYVCENEKDGCTVPGFVCMAEWLLIISTYVTLHSHAWICRTGISPLNNTA